MSRQSCSSPSHAGCRSCERCRTFVSSDQNRKKGKDKDGVRVLLTEVSACSLVKLAGEVVVRAGGVEVEGAHCAGEACVVLVTASRQAGRAQNLAIY